jgi:hypothetical protein
VAEPNAEIRGDCAATVENARDGGARSADVFGELGCGDGAEELFEQFAWACRVVDGVQSFQSFTAQGELSIKA